MYNLETQTQIQFQTIHSSIYDMQCTKHLQDILVWVLKTGSTASVGPTNGVVDLPVQANTQLLSPISPPLSFRIQ